MICPFCRREMVLTDYVEHQNMKTQWYFHCADCDKTFVILGQVFVDYETNNGIPASAGNAVPGRGNDAPSL